MLDLKESLFILGASPLAGRCCANISPQYMDCLFILLTMAFAEQKFLILTAYSLSLFSFLEQVVGAVSKNSSSNPRSSRILPVFS